jgi:hypothetical protein
LSSTACNAAIEEWITATQEEEALAIGETRERAHPVVVE